jgi:N-methylhydantoinase A
VWDRGRLEPGDRIEGPAIVEQMDATTLLLPDQVAAVDSHLTLVVEVCR